MLGSGDGPDLMTLRDLALVTAVVLALPAVAVILRDAVRADDRESPVGARLMHALWTALPMALLVLMAALAVQA